MSLAPHLLAHLDYWLRPGLRREYGGPFNDQSARALLCERLAALGAVRAVVETGTYRGTTTLFLARTFGVPVHSVEIEPRYHHYAKLRMRALPSVALSLGDSVSFLEGLARDARVPKRDVFFYLDAHRPGNVPLAAELELVCAHWSESLVMIDDFEVPDDPGYRFNDYGGGARFDERILPAAADGLRRFYPATPSEAETGHRRGCVLLVSDGPWAERVRSTQLVRERGGA